MPTIIDSLLIELGLDASKFNGQQRAAADAAKKGMGQIRKEAADAEDATSKVGDALGAVKLGALELFAAFAGGKEIVQFVKGITSADAAVGRLSRSTGASVQGLSAWQNLAKQYGGTAEGMASTFTSLSDAFAGFKVGQVSPLLGEFRNLSAAGGKFVDISKGVDQALIDISANLKAIHDRDPAEAGFRGRALGFDPATIDILIKGAGATRKLLEEVKALGTATAASADAATDLAKSWAKVEQAASGKARSVLNAKNAGGLSVMGALTTMLDTVAKDLSTPSREWGQGFRETTWDQWWQALRQGAGFGAPAAGASPPAASGAFTSQGEKEAFIRAEAAKRGINPNVAMAVARSEGFNDFTGDNGTSFGAFQLHVTPGGRGKAVGDQFRAATGLDPADRANERATIAFALDDARKNGWSAYHGAARSHISEWQGIERGGGTTVTNETNINGPITINAGPNADGATIAQEFRAELRRRQSEAAIANSGAQ